MTGTLDQARDDARQRAFHPGDDDDDARRFQAAALAEQAMQSGDADVVQPLDVVAHEFGGARRLFGDAAGRTCRRRRSRIVPVPGAMSCCRNVMMAASA